MTRLLEAYMPWFARVQDFARAPHGSLDEAVQRLDAWFAQARAAAAAQVPEHAELAAYAAAAWADERLQTSRWEHATQWSAHLLQRRHFGVLDAGDGFFRSLQELAPEQQQVREVFVLALLLGLRGRHALDHDDAALAQLREAELRQLPGGPPACAPLLVDAARDPDAAGGATTGHDALRRELRRARLPRRTSWLLAGCAALLALRAPLQQFADNCLADQLQQQREALLHTSTSVALTALPSDVEPAGAPPVHDTRLSLECSSGEIHLDNPNLPQTQAFAWSPQLCSTLRLHIALDGLQLERVYPGASGLADFLAEFRDGSHGFAAEDFAQQTPRLHDLGVRRITLHYRIDGAAAVLRTADALRRAEARDAEVSRELSELEQQRARLLRPSGAAPAANGPPEEPPADDPRLGLPASITTCPETEAAQAGAA